MKFKFQTLITSFLLLLSSEMIKRSLSCHLMPSVRCWSVITITSALTEQFYMSSEFNNFMQQIQNAAADSWLSVWLLNLSSLYSPSHFPLKPLRRTFSVTVDKIRYLCARSAAGIHRGPRVAPEPGLSVKRWSKLKDLQQRTVILVLRWSGQRGLTL